MGRFDLKERSRATVAVVAAACCALSFLATPSAFADPTPAVLMALQKGIAAARTGDCATALPLVAPALGRPGV